MVLLKYFHKIDINKDEKPEERTERLSSNREGHTSNLHQRKKLKLSDMPVSME